MIVMRALNAIIEVAQPVKRNTKSNILILFINKFLLKEKLFLVLINFGTLLFSQKATLQVFSPL